MPEELSDEQLEAEALAELNETPEEEVTEEEPQVEEDTTEQEEIQEEESTEESANEQVEKTVEDAQEGELAEPKEDDEETNPYGFKLNKPIPIKARGMEINIGTEKELVELAHKGFDYFKKTQELAEWRKSIDVLSETVITVEELRRLADVKGGNKEAVAAMLESYGVDPLMVEQEDAGRYQPQQIPETDYQVHMVAEELKAEPEHAQHFQ